MAGTKIDIQFTALPVATNVIELSNSSGVNMREEFESTRFSNNITEIATTIIQQAVNYIQSFGVDWNSTNLYDVSFDGFDTVTISPKDGVSVLGVVTNTAPVTITITNIAPPPVDFKISSVAFSQATADYCNKISVDVTANDTVDHQDFPISITGIASTTYSFDYERGNTINIQSTSTASPPLSDSFSVVLPDKLSVNNVGITVTQSLQGATVTATVSNVNLLSLQYSLDNVTWQTNNAFGGQLPGDYTMYIKDQYGCTISKAYTVGTFGVDDFGVTIPETYISKSCSFNFVKQATIDNIDTYKTDENVFAYDSLIARNDNNITEKDLFQTSDYITEQFLSNYETNTVNVVKEDGTTTNIPFIKKTTNIGRKDKRDCTYYSYSATEIGIYFTAGNTYDYDTGVSNGTYALNGALPEYAVIGTLININGVVLEVKQTLYDENVGYNVIIADYIYSGAPATAIISSIYNIENFEVYEYYIDFSNYLGLVEIQVAMTDAKTNFPDVTYITENIDVQTKHDYTLEIIYYNNTNSDVYYTTGLQHKIRLEFDSIEPILHQDFKNSINDNDTIAISSTVHEANKFTFSSVPNEKMKKIVLALSHKNIFINRVGYVKNSDVEIKTILGTNMSDISVEMIKTGIGYSLEGLNELNAVQIDTPDLLNVDNNYIKTS